MAENFNLIFGSQSPATASWSDADYQTGWNVVGSTPPTAEQFDALQNRSDKKAQELNNRMLPLEQKAEEQGRQAGTAYAVGAAVTVDGLPADWLLVCTTPGTSGTVAITLPDPLLDGATINDGTITWTLRKIATNGSLGYRQPSTAYTAGQIKYHSALPTGWYLACTTPGTSGSGELTISSPAIGGTVTDGTVTWTVSKDLSLSGGVIDGLLCNSNNNTYINIMGGTKENYNGATLHLMGKDFSGFSGFFQLSAINSPTNINVLEGRTDGALTWNNTDLAGSAIVAKLINTYGYIKYASGLIVAWSIDETFNDSKVVGFPISFSTGLAPLVIVQQRNSTTDFSDFQVVNVDHTQCKIVANNSNFHDVSWLAIGY